MYALCDDGTLWVSISDPKTDESWRPVDLTPIEGVPGPQIRKPMVRYKRFVPEEHEDSIKVAYEAFTHGHDEA